MYVINYSNDAGFAVVSKKRIETPLLAVTRADSFSNVEDIEIPVLKLFMECAKEYVANQPVVGAETRVGISDNLTYDYKTEEVVRRDTVEP